MNNKNNTNKKNINKHQPGWNKDKTIWVDYKEEDILYHEILPKYVLQSILRFINCKTLLVYDFYNYMCSDINDLEREEILDSKIVQELRNKYC